MKQLVDVVIIGVGNRMRMDDGAGAYTAELVMKQVFPEASRLPFSGSIGNKTITITEASGEGASLMELWQNAETVIIVDAVSSGVNAQPGTVYKFDALSQKIPVQFFHYSTHQFGVAEAIETARILKELPPKMLIYGIDGQNFQFGEGISESVKQAAAIVSEEIVQKIIK
jgi:hydrogenase maturation protease